MGFLNARRQLLQYLGLVILIILLLLLAVDFDDLVEAIRQTDWLEFALSVVFLLLAYAIYTLRTRYLLQNKVGYLDALSIDGGGFMFSVLIQLPRDIFRALAMNRSGDIDVSTTTSALTVGAITSMLVRVMGLMVAVLYGFASSREAQRPMLPSILSVLFFLLLLFVLAKNAERIRPYLARGLSLLPRISSERAEQTASRITQTLDAISSIRLFGIALFLRILIWVFSLLFYFYSFEAMNIEITQPHLLVPLAIMVVVPPTSPMMIGVFHGAVIAILGTLKIMDADLAAAYAINIHLVQMILLIIMGIFGMRHLNMKFSAILKEIRAKRNKTA